MRLVGNGVHRRREALLTPGSPGLIILAASSTRILLTLEFTRSVVGFRISIGHTQEESMRRLFAVFAVSTLMFCIGATAQNAAPVHHPPNYITIQVEHVKAGRVSAHNKLEAN